jgi:hypothetical protein
MSALEKGGGRVLHLQQFDSFVAELESTGWAKFFFDGQSLKFLTKCFLRYFADLIIY